MFLYQGNQSSGYVRPISIFFLFLEKRGTTTKQRISFRQFRAIRNSSQWILKWLFFLMAPLLLARIWIFLVILCCNYCIGTAIYCSSQHHEAYDPTDNTSYSHSDNWMTQVNRPWLWFTFTVYVGAISSIFTGMGVLCRTFMPRIVMPIDLVTLRSCRKTGPIQLIGNFQQVFPLPIFRDWTDDFITNSSWWG